MGREKVRKPKGKEHGRYGIGGGRRETAARSKCTQKRIAEAQERIDTINQEFGKKLQEQAAAEAIKENEEDKGGGGKSTTIIDDKEAKKRAAEELRAKKQQAKAIVAEEKAMMAELAQQYAQGEITYSEYLDRQAEIAQQSVDKRKALWKEGSANTTSCWPRSRKTSKSTSRPSPR